MSIFALRLARVYARVDVKPKALGFHFKGAEFGAELSPDPYADWSISQQELKLINKNDAESLTMTGDFAAYRFDQTEMTRKHFERIAETFKRFFVEIAPKSQPHRLGLRTEFVVEGSSFSELFPNFRKNTMRHEKAWSNVFGDRKIRDLGFANVHFGLEEDGVNLTTGILTPAQAIAWRDDKEFDLPEDRHLRISQGCLLIDLDRYRAPTEKEVSADLLERWYDELGRAADRLRKNLLT